MSRFVFGWAEFEEVYGETREEHTCHVCGNFGLRCDCDESTVCPETGEAHEWDEKETGPLDRSGRTDVYMECENCDASQLVGHGGVL